MRVWGCRLGSDFETQLIARPGIAAVPEAELRKTAFFYVPATSAIGNKYGPVPADLRRSGASCVCVLEVLHAFRSSGDRDDQGHAGGTR